MTKPEKIVYTAHASATGGREGQAKSDDGFLDVKLVLPKEMGGAGGGVNPEQMFAAGYAACFLGAMKFVAGKEKIALPADTKVNGAVGIGPIPEGFNIKVDLSVHVPGMDHAAAETLVEKAHGVCPYSNATRGNIDVTLKVI
ncbi:MAG: organic hydroperoxide resistance protein [Pseudomonadota bacterium]